MIPSCRPTLAAIASPSSHARASISLLALAGAVALAGCATVAPVSADGRSAAPGMVRGVESGPQDGGQGQGQGLPAGQPSPDREIKGLPDNLGGGAGGGQEFSIKGPPRNLQSQGQLPQGAGYNNPGGELMPQAPAQVGGDTHYHVHYHGNSAPAPTGYTPPSYGAPRPNNNLQSMNPYNQMPSAPIGTGGGGAGWYGPGGDGGPTGVRQGFGVGGWGTAGAYGSYANNGWWNGYTD